MKYIALWGMLSVAFLVIWCSSQPSTETTDNSQPLSISQNMTDIQSQEEQTTTIFALGDSLTAWYQLPIEESYPSQLQELLKQKWYNIKVINGGHSGDTSAQLLERVQRNISEAKEWDIVLLVIWANDWLQWLSLTELEANMRKIIDILQKKDLTIILWGMQLPLNQWQEYRQTFADTFPRLASEYNLLLIPFFLEWVAWDPTLNLPDGIHPTIEWYNIISTNITEFLEENVLPAL